MKDEKIKRFFRENTQKIENDGFAGRIFNHLEYLPRPEERISRRSLLVSIFAVAGLILFIILGGYSALISALGNIGSVISGRSVITPEVVIPVFLMICFMFAGGRYAIDKL